MNYEPTNECDRECPSTDENLHPDAKHFLGCRIWNVMAERASQAEPVYPPTPYDDAWESGYMPGSGENMYDDSYIDYLNNH